MALPAVVRASTTSSLGLGYLYIFLAVFGVLALLGGALITSVSHKAASKGTSAISNFGKFFYASFLKPHNRHGTQGGQQAALESFYNAQVSSFKRFRESVSNMIAHGMLQERFRSLISVWRPEKDKKKGGILHGNLPIDFIGQFGTTSLLVILAGTCGDGA